ncbi:C40 family peptidase [Kitasatospora sp. NPDC049285]|uniref:C40 family peptidase n=1 Tax=Kitasatospora sp. NPDC049285 TaxID=3157096 RepID=UPI00343B17DD
MAETRMTRQNSLVRAVAVFALTAAGLASSSPAQGRSAPDHAGTAAAPAPRWELGTASRGGERPQLTTDLTDRPELRGADHGVQRLPVVPPPAAQPAAQTVVEPVTEARGERAVRLALEQVGKPYRWGAEGPDSFDCSGLIEFVYGKSGVELPRTTWDQLGTGRRVNVSEIAPGDLVFYHQGSHVALYIGGGKVVHAPHTGTDVRVAELDMMPVQTVVRLPRAAERTEVGR